ncbi:MAG: hypothetical protein COV44_10865 [Deltaproteobacteria bacterium CG11_big_fil_rev_8_21_14_0_20_45_16]|nr:MAG: hypothetical protein COV44_10865 [Deltaproteobacteria bacterium CG11_big_fil_rev_8_21_14_0_20_45_16]
MGENISKTALIWLIGGILSLSTACSDSKELLVEYQAPSTAEPDLVFLVDLEDRGDGSYRFVSSLDSSSFGASYDDSIFGIHLISCAEEMEQVEAASFPEDAAFHASSCLNLGAYIRDVIFNQESVQLDQITLATRPSLVLNDQSTHIFAIFVYNAGSLSASPRCAQLRVAKNEGQTFRIKSDDLGFVTVDSLSIQLPTPDEATNCVSLAATE